MTRLVDRSRAVLALLMAVMLLLVAACGDDPAPGETPADPTAADAGADTTEAPAASTDDLNDADPNNPWVLGWQVTGAPGGMIEGTATYTQNGGELEQSADRLLNDDGIYRELNTVFVEGLRLDITATPPGETTVEIYVGRFVDPSDPVGDIDVREVLDSATLNQGESATVEASLTG